MSEQPRLLLTRVELDHLLTLLRDASQDGSYYGPREQYRKRSDRIWRKLEDEYNMVAASEGWPLRDRRTRNDSSKWGRAR